MPNPEPVDWKRLDDYNKMLDAPDLPLLERENPDLCREAIDLVGGWWLETPNAHLYLKTPNQLIKEGRGARVRDLLRQITLGAMS